LKNVNVPGRSVPDISLATGQILELFPRNHSLQLNHEMPLASSRKEDRPVKQFVDGRSARIVEQGQKTRIAVIDDNALARSCLMQCLTAMEADFVTEGYRGVEDWRQMSVPSSTSIVLLCATGQKSTEIAVHQNVDVVIEAAPEAGVIVVSDFEDRAEIIGALERGARGFISMSSELEVAIAAIRLVRAGGTFVPASGLMSRPLATSPEDEVEISAKGRFTERQLEVIERLRKGESNKIIAYKLSMGECTVKVHVRNIMRKLKARNRTEIAFLTNDMF
jgi:DNA-binding NarL/FixJ family response regulator